MYPEAPRTPEETGIRAKYARAIGSVVNPGDTLGVWLFLWSMLAVWVLGLFFLLPVFAMLEFTTRGLGGARSFDTWRLLLGYAVALSIGLVAQTFVR